jgi:hypothetical protein
VLSDGRNTLRGPHIRYEQATQQVRVHGPGTLEGMFEADEAGAGNGASPPRPVRIAWDSGLNFNGHDNAADVNGNVNVTTREPDGTQLHFSADRVLVAFADEPAVTKAAAREDDRAGADERQVQLDYFDVMRGKTWQRVTLDGSARVESLLIGPDDSKLRRMSLLGPQVQYNLETGEALVPAKGQILLQDTLERPAGDDRNDQPNGRLLDGFRGATAIQWGEKLQFMPDSKQAILSGGVTVVHQDPDRENANIRLESGRAVLQFAQAPIAAAHPPAANGNGRLFDMSSLQLSSLRADGSVRVLLPQIAIDALEASYDASSQLLTARGTERQPVQLLDPQGISQGSFEEVVWDARAEQIQRMRNVQAQVRR